MDLSRPFPSIAVAFLVAWLHVEAEAAQEFRAIWADAWHEGFQSPAEARQLVATVRTANCNAVFVQVRKRGDAYYRPSAFEPAARSVRPDFDPLAEVIRLAHDTNAGPRVEVHAWFVAYPLTTVMRLSNKEPVITAKFYTNHLFSLHRDWLDRTKEGTDCDGREYFLDPGHAEVQKHLFKVAMDIISRYDIDGFHFDHVTARSSSARPVT